MEKYCTAGQGTDGYMADAHCMVDNEGYKHILRMCNNYCFSIATMVERTLFIVTLYVHYFVINDIAECTAKEGRNAPVNRQVMRVFKILSPL